MRLQQAGETLDVVVSDDGVGIGTAAESSGLGLGVPLMDDLADEVQVDAPAGTRIAARFELFGAAGPHGRRVPRSALQRPHPPEAQPAAAPPPLTARSIPAPIARSRSSSSGGPSTS